MKRNFTVATFVVTEQKVLLLYHRKLRKWLPPGGHIEPNELPDEAAVREVKEETGIDVELIGERALPIETPRQLVIPQGIQVEPAGPGKENIDFVYFARPLGSREIRKNDESLAAGWYDKQALQALPLTEVIALWVQKALQTFTSL